MTEVARRWSEDVNAATKIKWQKIMVEAERNQPVKAKEEILKLQKEEGAGAWTSSLDQENLREVSHADKGDVNRLAGEVKAMGISGARPGADGALPKRKSVIPG